LYVNRSNIYHYPLISEHALRQSSLLQSETVQVAHFRDVFSSTVSWA